MADRIHVLREGTSENGNITLDLEQLLPPGSGFVKVNPDRSLTLETPSGGSGTGAPPFREILTVTATNALSQLSYTPRPNTVLLLHVRGKEHSTLAADFTVSGKTITIAPGGYQILPGWAVEAEYYTDETITAPTITSFAPTSASVGATVVITGTGFFGVQSLTIGGVAQTTYTVDSATQITVTLVAGAYPLTPSNVVVVTSSGTGSRAGFTYLDPTPTISALSTTLSAIGNTVVITGTNFTSVTAVRFGGVNAANFVVNSSTQITAVIADTGASGTVQVQTAFGTATSAQSVTLAQILAFPRAGQVMTANTTTLSGVTYTASGNANNAGQEPYQAFTLNASVFYFGVTAAGTEFLRLQASLRFKETTYTIFAPNVNTNHLPRTWVYEASNDGTTWVTLDSRTAQTLAANTQYDFPVTSNAGYYTQRRIRILATQAAGWPPALRLRFNP